MTPDEIRIKCLQLAKEMREAAARRGDPLGIESDSMRVRGQFVYGTVSVDPLGNVKRTTTSVEPFDTGDGPMTLTPEERAREIAEGREGIGKRAEDLTAIILSAIREAEAAAYERAAQVAEHALWESAGEPIRPGLVPIKKNATVEAIVDAIRKLKGEGE